MPTVGRRAVLPGAAVALWALSTVPCGAQGAGAAPPTVYTNLSEGLQHAFSPTARIVTAVGLLVAAALLTTAYIVSRRLDAARRREVEDRVGGSLTHVLGLSRDPVRVRPGDGVEIESIGGKVRRLYHSQVVDVSASRITLAAPRQEGAVVPLAVGDRIGVVVKQRPYSYRFESVVLARERLPLPVVVVEHKHDLVRFERREFSRSDVAVDCRFELFYGTGVLPTALGRPGRIVDISGSGCRLETFGPTHKVRFVAMEFRLPMGFPLSPGRRRGRRETPPRGGKAAQPLPRRATSGATRPPVPHAGPKRPPSRPVRVVAEVIPAASTGLGAPQGGVLGCRFIEIAAGDRENVVAFVLAAERESLHIRRERELARSEAGEARPAERPSERPGAPGAT